MKNHYLIAFAILISNISYSYCQETNLNSEFLKYFNQNNFLNAISYAKEIENKTTIENKKDENYASFLNLYGQCYQKLGEDSLSEKYFLQSINLYKSLGIYNDYYFITLYNLCFLYYDQNKFNLAENAFLDYIKNWQMLKRAPNKSYAYFIAYLGKVYENQNKIVEAENTYTNVISIFKNIFGEDDKQYQFSLIQLANFYSKIDSISKAETLYLKVLELKKKYLGEKDSEYAISLDNLGSFYEKIAKYSEAEKCYLEACSIRKEVLGEKHADYSNSLNTLGVYYQRQSDFKKAENFYLKALEIRKESINENIKDYTYSINNLGFFYDSQNEFKKAELLFIELLANQKRIFGEISIEYLSTLNNLAVIYEHEENLNESEKSSIKVLSITKKLYNEQSPEVAIATNLLGKIYLNKADYNTAETYFLSSLSIWEKIHVEEIEKYIAVLNNLGVLYQNQALFSKSINMYEKALTSIKQNHLETKSYCAFTLDNLASVYRDMGFSSKAEPLYFEALKIRKDNLKNNEMEYTISLNNVGLFYAESNQYTQAEVYYLEAMKLIGTKIGKKNTVYASLLSNLGSLYMTQGMLDKVEHLYIESLEIRKELFGEIHPDIAISLNALADFYDLEGNEVKAENYYKNALSIRKAIYGESHPIYAQSLNTLAITYSNHGNYKQAESLFSEALKIEKSSLGENHPDYAITLGNIAMVYDDQGDFLKADSIYNVVISIKRITKGETNSDYAISLSNLGVSYSKRGLFEKAEKELLKASKIFKLKLGCRGNEQFISIQNLSSLFFENGKSHKADSIFIENNLYSSNIIKSNLNYYSENDWNFYRKKSSINRFNELSFHLKYPNYNSSLPSSLETQWLLKGIALKNFTQMTNSAHNSKDTMITNLYFDYGVIKRKLEKLYTSEPSNNQAQIKTLEEESERLEKELIRSSSTFRELQKAFDFTYHQVASKLKPNEALIEWVDFNYYNHKWTDSILYAAFVVRKDWAKPKFVFAFEQKQLNEIIGGNQQQDSGNRQNNIYDYTQKGEILNKLVIQPFDSLLQGVTKVYVANSGLLNLINMADVPINQNLTFGEKYFIHNVGSTADILQYQPTYINTQTVKQTIVYGGINYSDRPNSNWDKLFSNSPITYSTSSRSGIGSWAYLPGTKKEAEAIEKQSLANHIPAIIYSGIAASEQSIKKLSGKKEPFILHIATHGFFFPDTSKQKLQEPLIAMNANSSSVFKVSENPLMRSGLLFAGANKTWANPNMATVSTDDGILTAYEVSNLDLSSCKLVVLSACETGLGDIKGSEGVFGLQRAFKMAGVKNIIMSLWKVPDEQTTELFDEFYKQCFAGKSIDEALKMAQQKMKAKYPPYYWAGFKLLE